MTTKTLTTAELAALRERAAFGGSEWEALLVRHGAALMATVTSLEANQTRLIESVDRLDHDLACMRNDRDHWQGAAKAEADMSNSRITAVLARAERAERLAAINEAKMLKLRAAITNHMPAGNPTDTEVEAFAAKLIPEVDYLHVAMADHRIKNAQYSVIKDLEKERDALKEEADRARRNGPYIAEACLAAGLGSLEDVSRLADQVIALRNTATRTQSAEAARDALKTALANLCAPTSTVPLGHIYLGRRLLASMGVEIPDAGGKEDDAAFARIRSLLTALHVIRERAVGEVPEIESPPGNRLQRIFAIADGVLTDDGECDIVTLAERLRQAEDEVERLTANPDGLNER